ncbi:hypothetical protein KCU99_g4794, partial [Aureobasidium melanogenum]
MAVPPLTPTLLSPLKFSATLAPQPNTRFPLNIVANRRRSPPDLNPIAPSFAPGAAELRQYPMEHLAFSSRSDHAIRQPRCHYSSPHGSHDAASHWEEGVQIQSQLWGVSWLLWLEPGPYFYRSGLWNDTATFEHLVHTVKHLESVFLGSSSLHSRNATENFINTTKHLKPISLGSENQHLLVDALASLLRIVIGYDWEDYAMILGKLKKFLGTAIHLKITIGTNDTEQRHLNMMALFIESAKMAIIVISRKRR